MRRYGRGIYKILILTLTMGMFMTGCSNRKNHEVSQTESVASQADSEVNQTEPVSSMGMDRIPAFSGFAYVAIEDNIPTFSETDYTTRSFEEYSNLDSLGRCGVAYACVGRDIMPTEERGTIGQVKPTGWQTVKYDNVEGRYLYNRCHLIGYQLTGENANEKNLITGTRYLNIEGMLPFENMVADYVKETGNHVLYRVLPVFDEDNLVATGVEMEGYSVEDQGKGISYHVFAYNYQPGITIDYATGMSEQDDNQKEPTGNKQTYILNKNNRKFHEPDCRSVKQMKEDNKQSIQGTREELISQGYSPCGNCNP